MATSRRFFRNAVAAQQATPPKFTELASELNVLTVRMRESGLFKTAIELDKAKLAMGYEMANVVKKAMKA